MIWVIGELAVVVGFVAIGVGAMQVSKGRKVDGRRTAAGLGIVQICFGVDVIVLGLGTGLQARPGWFFFVGAVVTAVILAAAIGLVIRQLSSGRIPNGPASRHQTRT